MANAISQMLPALMQAMSGSTGTGDLLGGLTGAGAAPTNDLTSLMGTGGTDMFSMGDPMGGGVAGLNGGIDILSATPETFLQGGGAGLGATAPVNAGSSPLTQLLMTVVTAVLPQLLANKTEQAEPAVEEKPAAPETTVTDANGKDVTPAPAADPNAAKAPEAGAATPAEGVTAATDNADIQALLNAAK